MGHKFIPFLLFILINKFSFTQILSVDREIKRDSLKNDAIIFDLFFSGAKIKGDLITLKGKLEYDHFFDNDYFIMCLGTIKSLVNGNEIIQNKGYFQMRFRDDDTRRISPDGFAQYQWNGLQGMDYRALSGGNIRFRWFDKEKNDLYSSLGLFYEREKWNPLANAYAFDLIDSSIVIRNIFRLNLSSKFAVKFNKFVDFAGLSYLQFPINENYLNPRWFLDLSLNLSLNDHIGFVVSYNHNFDTYTALPIDKYFYSMSMGIRIRY